MTPSVLMRRRVTTTKDGQASEEPEDRGSMDVAILQAKSQRSSPTGSQKALIICTRNYVMRMGLVDIKSLEQWVHIINSR